MGTRRRRRKPFATVGPLTQTFPRVRRRKAQEYLYSFMKNFTGKVITTRASANSPFCTASIFVHAAKHFPTIFRAWFLSILPLCPNISYSSSSSAAAGREFEEFRPPPHSVSIPSNNTPLRNIKKNSGRCSHPKADNVGRRQSREGGDEGPLPICAGM